VNVPLFPEEEEGRKTDVALKGSRYLNQFFCLLFLLLKSLSLLHGTSLPLSQHSPQLLQFFSGSSKLKLNMMQPLLQLRTDSGKLLLLKNKTKVVKVLSNVHLTTTRKSCLKNTYTSSLPPTPQDEQSNFN